MRIPIYSKSPKSKRIEFRCPDPSTNPYLCFAAQLMAGLDGVQNKIDPGEPIDKDLYDLEPEEAEQVRSTPGSLGEVLDALEKDHAWLLKGDVFTPDVIETWITYKREARAGADQPPARPLRVLPLLRPVSRRIFWTPQRLPPPTIDPGVQGVCVRGTRGPRPRSTRASDDEEAHGGHGSTGRVSGGICRAWDRRGARRPT